MNVVLLKDPVSHETALGRGYRYLTTCYGRSTEEQRMLRNVVEDMERGGIDYVLVGFVDAGRHVCQIARRGMRDTRSLVAA